MNHQPRTTSHEVLFIMKRSFLYLLGAIALAAGSLLLERPDRSPDAATATRRFFAELAPAKVARIQVERLLDGVELRRAGDTWSVQSFETPLRKQVTSAESVPHDDRTTTADGVKVGDALAALQQLTTTSLVSTNPEQQVKYQVNQLGLQVRAFDADGALLASIVVGKQGPDFFSTYVRKNDEAKVYLTRESLAARFPTAIEYWRPTIVPHPAWLFPKS